MSQVETASNVRSFISVEDTMKAEMINELHCFISHSHISHGTAEIRYAKYRAGNGTVIKEFLPVGIVV